jgi:hypothetical protein
MAAWALASMADGAAGLVALAAAGTIAVAGAASAVLLARARRWTDTALVVAAALALAGLVADLAAGTRPAGTVAVGRDLTPARARAAAALNLQGDGLRAAEWQDLPARALQGPAARADGDGGVTLDFPRQLALGRPFDLTLRRSLPLAGWRLQLQDENGQLLAQATAQPPGNTATLRWLPPVAEAMRLQARVLDAQGRVLEHGPIPLRVQASTPLQVQGRFGAPSFDLQALNSLLVGSDALIDWQVTLGKTVTRQETARSAMATPDLLVIDAAYFERAPAPVRAALLAQVAQGRPMLVLAANASEPALWARELQLPLEATAGEVTRTPGPDAAFVLPVTAWSPPTGAKASLGPWAANDAAAPWLWQRPWQAGRIAWLGVSDWHRAAISAPQALGAWWQTVLDQAGVRHAAPLAWDFPDAMPLAGERSRVCMRGASTAQTEMAVDLPGLNQRLHLQRRPDIADAACAAFWPRQAGWQRLQGLDAATPATALYVFAADDWPAWQRALRLEATARYAARALPAAEAFKAPLPAWPWALAFAAAMLALWWRERR